MHDPLGRERRISLAINLELNPGPHGASARVELHPLDHGSAGVMRLRGRLEDVALRRLAQTLEDLSARDVRHLLIDCSELGDIPVRFVAPLMDALERFESQRGHYRMCGLSHRLTDRFRFAGWEAGPHSADTLAELFDVPPRTGVPREWAS